MKHKREWYIPKGAVCVKAKDCEAVAYLHETAGKPYAVIFLGKAQKPAFNYRYKSAERRAQHIAEVFASRKASEQFKIEQRQKYKSKGRGLEVGDILRNSWGYEQTNIDYFEVTALIGAKMVEIREIGCKSVETAWAQGESVPMPGNYIGEPMRKVAKDGRVKIHDWGSWARKMEPAAEVAGVKVYSASHWTAYH